MFARMWVPIFISSSWSIWYRYSSSSRGFLWLKIFQHLGFLPRISSLRKRKVRSVLKALPHWSHVQSFFSPMGVFLCIQKVSYTAELSPTFIILLEFPSVEIYLWCWKDEWWPKAFPVFTYMYVFLPECVLLCRLRDDHCKLVHIK